MDPALTALFVRLAEIAATRTATAVTDRISAVKAKNKNEETIQTLQEIVNSLISDREELIGIAQGLKEQLVSQQISDEDINHMVNTVFPIVERMSSQSGESEQETSEYMNVIRQLLSQDTLKVLQTLGFNFRKAIGEPLTQVVHSYVASLEKRSDATKGRRKARN